MRAHNEGAPMRRLVPIGARAHRRGFIMVVSLLILVVMTLLALAMFRSFGLQERIAGNTRDKQRAFEAAESALQYGEWWLRQGNGGSGASCAGAVDGNTLTNMRVCSNALSNPADLPWDNRTEYVPPRMTVSAGGGVTSAGDVNYAGKPGLYVQYLGLSPDGLTLLYQVNGYGYGGNADTASVVQSTYQMKSGVKDLGGL